MSSTRTNDEWLHDLRESGMAQENAIADLQSILLRAVLYLFNRNLGEFRGLTRGDTLKLAEDCAQEALIAVLNHLPDFRGDSKFTTWVYKFAINIALTAVRRTRWRDVSLDQMFLSEGGAFSEWTMQDKSPAVAPDRSAMQGEVRHVIQEVFERDLTDNQRRVLILIVFNEVPMDEVVRQLDTNRNAIYKMLHDARRKLKSGLQLRGFEVGETLALFSSHR
ncbi:MAG: sigma-70 family RNA polymerase sigma factor [Anaerolineales bacterium]